MAKLEQGDKIILPPSALHKLASKNTTYPMMFEVSTTSDARSNQPKKLHCGVLEFDADEGCAYFPKWMMEALGLSANGLVCVFNVTLPPGNSVVFRPQSVQFTRLSNPRAVLENRLSKFSCLTLGQSVPVFYLERIFWLDVTALKGPAGSVSAVSIVETDIVVEFEEASDAQTASPALSAASPSATASSASSSVSSFDLASPAASASASSVFAASPVATAAAAAATAAAPVVLNYALQPVAPVSYFARLGSSGQRVNGKPVSSPDRSLTRASSSSASSASFQSQAPPPPAPPALALTRAATSSGVTASARPVSALVRTMSASNSASAAVSAFASTSASTSASASASSAPDALPLSRAHSVNAAGNRVFSELDEAAGFRYVYEITPANHKRLLRREKYVPLVSGPGHVLVEKKAKSLESKP